MPRDRPEPSGRGRPEDLDARGGEARLPQKGAEHRLAARAGPVRIPRQPAVGAKVEEHELPSGAPRGALGERGRVERAGIEGAGQDVLVELA
jgi:hypothetical protein